MSSTAPPEGACDCCLPASQPAPLSPLPPKTGRLAVVRRLLAAGASPDVASSAGATPLMLAAAEGHCDVVQELCAAGE